jgi:hypothetical protein
MEEMKIDRIVFAAVVAAAAFAWQGDNDSSRAHFLYVREFSPNSIRAGKWLVSKRGGSNPLWRGDGKELIYIAADRQLMAVEVTSNPVFQAGAAQPLFQLPAGFIAGDVAADGKRFLFALPAEQSGQTPFTVVLNWEAGLHK